MFGLVGFFVEHSDFHLLFVLDLESEDLTIEVGLLATLLMGCSSLDLLPYFNLDERIHLAKELSISLEDGVDSFHVKLVFRFGAVDCLKHDILTFDYTGKIGCPLISNLIRNIRM